eukprot:SAG31_NODE_1035_length_10225_cov_2.372506_5_plen_155_part_00
MTDGTRTPTTRDPLPLIRERNGGAHGQNDSPVSVDNARIFTYTFGDDGDRSLMQTIACENGGIHTTIPDSSNAPLKEAMANYFVYLAAGMHPDTSDDDPTVRWVDVYEDGQGRGQVTAACSPVYNFGTDAEPEVSVIHTIFKNSISTHLHAALM